MVKALLAAAMLIAAPAQSDKWVVLTEQLSYTTYVDASSVQFSEDMTLVQAWELDDYKEAPLPGSEYKSARILKEYDCGDDSYRILHLIVYTGRMGGGEPQGEAVDGHWTPVVPGSVGAFKHSRYCALMRFMQHSSLGT